MELPHAAVGQRALGDLASWSAGPCDSPWDRLPNDTQAAAVSVTIIMPMLAPMSSTLLLLSLLLGYEKQVICFGGLPMQTPGHQARHNFFNTHGENCFTASLGAATVGDGSCVAAAPRPDPRASTGLRHGTGHALPPLQRTDLPPQCRSTRQASSTVSLFRRGRTRDGPPSRGSS